LHSEETQLSPEEAYELLANDDIVTIAIPPVFSEIYFFKPDEEANST